MIDTVLYGDASTIPNGSARFYAKQRGACFGCGRDFPPTWTLVYVMPDGRRFCTYCQQQYWERAGSRQESAA